MKLHLYREMYLTMLMLICLFNLTPCQVSSSTRDTLTQGDSLSAMSRLVSAGNVFTLGFFTPAGSNNTYIAIWQTSVTYYSAVWIGNRDNPIPNNSSANLTISRTGSLLITTGEEDTFPLFASSEARTNVSATLYRTGNFVLKEVSASGEDVILWQSFDYPTDTLLPGMKLGIDHRTGRRWRLTSWLRPSNPASGAFTFEWESITRRLIIRQQGVFYWTSGELRGFYDMYHGRRLKEFENLNPPDVVHYNYNFTNFTSNDEEYFMYSLIRDERVPYRGWRLGNEGDIIDHNTGSVEFPRFPIRCDRCRCTYNRREEQRPVSGYFRLPIGGSPLPVPDVNLDISLSDCMESCWNDCECAGFTLNGSGCMYWIGRNLKFVETNHVIDSYDGTYVRESGSSNNGKKMMLMWIIIPVVAAILLLLVVTALIRMRQSKRRKGEAEMNELLTLEGYTGIYEHEKGGAKGHDLRLFTYTTIVAATSNFSSEYKLGEGGFGPVYKGRTIEGRDIAVKVLSRSSGQGLLEFKTELILISKLQHVNLVKLVGFCIHADDKIIVYDYMPNKSLDFFLFDPTKREQLDWGRRINVIEGIAQGLLYLHKHSRLSIVHRDLKCSNILLDENLNPKISDFGLARIFKQNIVEANTNRRVGTVGYMAPEYAMQGIFSFKSDVYSFGVLVLETVTGRKNSSFHHIEGPLNLVEYAWELWGKDTVLELMDPTLNGSCNTEQFHRFINIGLLCVENRAVDRPNIEDILSMVKNEATSLPRPKNPAFITRNSVIQELGTTTPDKLSANELSISEIGGR